ncbi:MAG TPA: hypothetical protein VG408_07600, partial [Actinomycetota bacterium]|nr:hypothetical protein [Actinomycetota bacterium]
MTVRLDLRTEHRVLAAFARGVLGRAYTPEVPDQIVTTLSQLPSEKDRKQLLGALRALDTKGGALLLTGRPVPASWLSAAEAESVLQRWKRSRVKMQRQLAGGLISASVASLYGHPTAEWARIGYPGPSLGDPPADTPRRFEPIEIERDERLSCDVVVVGSGPGGQCVASHLARAGLDVII